LIPLVFFSLACSRFAPGSVIILANENKKLLVCYTDYADSSKTAGHFLKEIEEIGVICGWLFFKIFQFNNLRHSTFVSLLTRKSGGYKRTNYIERKLYTGYTRA